MISIPLFLSQQHPCSYLDNKTARSAFVHPSVHLSGEIYSHLLELGFRRSGSEVYRPDCPTCSKCVPVRIPIRNFKPSRKHKRCLQKNQTTQTTIRPALFNKNHYHLYQKYQLARHGKGGMADSSSEEYMNFLSSVWCDTWFVEFTIKGQLAAVAIVDHLDNALSAVYTFFDPVFSKYSPGVYAILWQIEKAKQQKKDWLYLGFWVANCRKMQYKTQFRPTQGLIDDRWQDILPS